MRILIWNSPFIVQGNLFFSNNAFKKTLLPQAEALVYAGHNVDIVFTETTRNDAKHCSGKLGKIFISYDDVVKMLGSFYDPSCDLYKDAGYKYNNIANVLKIKLQKKYDVILLWETPVPFLEKMFPEALIVHQMPGTFSRAPYPNFITFDLYGLYKSGTIYKYWKDIVNFSSGNNLVNDFMHISTEIFNNLNIFKEKFLLYRKKFDTISLIPLQVSSHYNFKIDTPYVSQTEFLIDTFSNILDNEVTFVTQYVTPNMHDTVINEKLLNFIASKKKNIIWEPIFDNIESVSQYIVPFIDKIYSVSSSLLFQSFLWNKEVVVQSDSCMKPYSNAELYKHGINIEIAQKNSLDFFLNRHQILAESLIAPHFISSLLEELVYKKKKGTKSIDSYSSLIDIDKNYHDKIMSSFRKARSNKNLLPFFPDIINSNTQLDKIKKIINDKSINIISFDIFDTLISRVVEKPIDIYRFLQERAFIESNGVIENFMLLRIQAEKETRKDNKSEETTLDRIYTYINKTYNIDSALLIKLKQYELDLELKLSTAHPLGFDLFKIAKESGKRIILISDMYLPHNFIEELLHKNGFYDIDSIYISCELGLSKRKGDIYPYILEDQHIDPSMILHFGDNKKSDIEMAEKAGLKTYYLCNAITRMYINKFYKKIFPMKSASTKARAACVGLIALKNFSRYIPRYEKESLFLGSTYLMGYNALGMLLTSYALWLAKKARELNLSDLYFLSREGWLIKKAYDIVAKYIPHTPKSHYLYASRRALNIAMLEKESDIITIASLPFSHGSIVRDLIKHRFGILITEQDSKDYLQKLDYTPDGRLHFINICQSIRQKIMSAAHKERTDYIKYLTSMNCFDVDRMAIVDIGWKGRMQTRLSRILKKKVFGFYYSTISESEYGIGLGNSMYTFLTYSADSTTSSYVVNNRQLCELLICSSERSLESIVYENGNFIKNFVDEPKYNIRKLFIQELHSGCIDFVTDFAKYFHNFFETMFISPELSTSILQAFTKETSPLDYKLIQDIAFDDKIGGVSQRNMVELVKKVEGISPASNDKRLQTNKNTNRWLLQIEKYFITLFCNKRKQAKYKDNRKQFFEDSKHGIIKLWYNIISK